MMDKRELHGRLFTTQAKEYGPLYTPHLLDIYKACLEMADRVSARRQTANSFFVTLNTTLTGLIGYVHLRFQEDASCLWLISVAGLAVCYMWFHLILSYRQLNKAKFTIINEIETRLPISPFMTEWTLLRNRDKSPKLRRYLSMTQIELVIPWIFFVLHAVILIRRLG